ncbi:Ribosomal large subunit pseudouridine synthase D [bioreactor metagenome]|uniref:Ribosomal large subunit pseudouridine synthase D n=1 Tax=bioreactor metagenome TaxID=1076179 RepID=A0A645EU96_9ZZZZ
MGDTDGGDLVPVPGPLDILYEDEDLLLVNKAPGVATHPGPGHYDDTLGNYLAEYYREKGILAAYHPVNRLDRSTSGVMAVAKHAHAQQRLIPQLHTGAFARSYLALCRGAPQPARGVVDASIGRAEGSALRREVRPDGAPARTGYQVLETFGDRALLRLEPETGRTHQIRVHMAYLGCPLLGDFLYGVEEPALIARAALHAHRLRLVHPLSGAALEAEAPLPADMSALLPPDVRKKFCF